MSFSQKLHFSDRCIQTAIVFAPVEAALGYAAKDYFVRELVDADGDYFDERGARLLKTTSRRTYALRVTVVHRDRPRWPVVSLIASKGSSKSKTLTVHRTQSDFVGVDEDVSGRLVHLMVLVAQLYGHLAGATTLHIRDVDSVAFQGMLVAAGFDIRKKNGFLYAKRKILHTVAPVAIH